MRPSVFRRAADGKQVQPQRVRDHAEAGQAHRRRRKHGIQRKPGKRHEHARRHRNPNTVVEKRPEHVALDAADIVLVKSKLTDVSAAVRLSRQVLKNIHENLFWAFFYNCIGIPVAAGVLVPFTGALSAHAPDTSRTSCPPHPIL